ncbi:AraC family transcriptional regulator [Clostridiaceae bacterium]|nr:AraC family transcriptional regulator [Clostridiaceae bacterium]
MKYEIVELKEKIAIGVSVQTGNVDPNLAAALGGLWDRLFKDGIYATIPGKINEKALGIYTEYKGEDKSSYTAIAACETADAAEVKDCMVCRIPAGKYAKFVVHGDMVSAVASAWQEIGQMDLPRTYQCDFEEYQDDNMEDSEIHIYVGIC